MKVVFDIEANGLENPTKIWLIVCKDIETNEYYIFRNLYEHEEARRFEEFSRYVDTWIGHNIVGYDVSVIRLLLGLDIPVGKCLDTLILSKLVDYSRNGHSIEDYGLELGQEKGKFTDFSAYSKDMEEYCIRDVDICHLVYRKYLKYINNPERQRSIRLEHSFQLVVNDLHANGFALDVKKASSLLGKVEAELAVLDKDILDAFPPREVLIREFTPRETKYGTVSKTSVPRSLWDNISEYEVGKTYRHTRLEDFNPSSHKQIISVLSEAGWKPVDKTKTHIEAERERNKLQREARRNSQLDIKLKELDNKLDDLRRTGWKVNEANLVTLPPSAPKPIRSIANRIILEARRRTLTEWLGLLKHQIEIELTQFGMPGIATNGTQTQCGEKSSELRINVGEQTTSTSQGKATVNHTLNFPTDLRSKKFLSWLRSKKVNAQFVKENENCLWITVTGQEQLESFCAETATATLDGMKSFPLKYKVIASRIHGRFYGIGAWSHRMSHQNPNTANIPNEYDITGKKKIYGKELRSLWIAPKNRLLVGCDAEGIQLRIFAHYIDDPEFTKEVISGDVHTLNQSILGAACRTRDAAKRFIYAMLLGAGLGKLGEILGCEQEAASAALARLVERYQGFALLKEKVIPADAKRGWFVGLDGRAVAIPGDDLGTRKHLAMSGYLQNGEAVVMKMATLKWWPLLKDMNAKIVNFVHDEWQVECPNNMEVALRIANMQADSLRKVGEELNLKCPLAGSFWNKKAKDYTIDTNWSKTH